MGDSLITVIAIVLAGIVIFVFPLMSISERNDDIAQQAVQSAVTEFANEVAKTGVLTLENYDKLIQTLSATGHSYQIEFTRRVRVENPGKKAAEDSTDRIDGYGYEIYTSQILEELQQKGSYKFANGDGFSVDASNTDRTIAQQLREVWSKISGSGSYKIEGKSNVVVMYL